jgi:O-acetyl-ADP-ribose deacetylase
MEPVIPDPNDPSNTLLARIKAVTGDVTKQDVDAIITLIPQNLEYRGSLNQAILDAAGKRLDDFVLENIYRPRFGDVYAVPGFNMRCQHILFCIMPLIRSSLDREDKHLLIAMRKAMEQARAMSLKSVAIPPLACGRKGYPRARGARLIIQGIMERLDDTIEEIRIVCPEDTTLKVFTDRLKSYGWNG